jgi:3-hydroxyacyl-[acyl-carrier-protein] dehydratase
VVKKPLILDPSEIDTSRVVADIEEIRRYNPQRYEMEQLTAICYEDTQNHVCAGYKDLGPDEFWARGHIPGMPLMPGVLMCEASAQLASYYSRKHKLVDGFIGFGGLEDVRFRGIVRPGERFLIVSRLLRVRQSIMTAEFQCFVRELMVCEGIIKGVALPVEELAADNPQNA